MHILVILAHPDPRSFNHALAGAACTALRQNGHTVIFHDLHAERFDPIIPAAEIPKDGPVPPEIQRHCDELAHADGLVIVHPNWWGQPPAILTGWIDRVFRPGLAYRFLEGDNGEGVPVGLLKAQAAIIFNTSNTPDAREQAAFGDPLESIWKRCLFELCGIRHCERRMFNVIATSSLAQRQAWLEEAGEMVDRVFPACNP